MRLFDYSLLALFLWSSFCTSTCLPCLWSYPSSSSSLNIFTSTCRPSVSPACTFHLSSSFYPPLPDHNTKTICQHIAFPFLPSTSSSSPVSPFAYLSLPLPSPPPLSSSKQAYLPRFRIVLRPSLRQVFWRVCHAALSSFLTLQEHSALSLKLCAEVYFDDKPAHFVFTDDVQLRSLSLCFSQYDFLILPSDGEWPTKKKKSS